MSGKEIRLGKLFSRGPAVVVAADHGSYMGPFPGIENLKYEINAFKKADAFLLMPGMAKQCREFFSDKDSPLLIVRVNWAAHYCKGYMKETSPIEREVYYDKGFNEMLCSVQYAASIGADIVIVSLLLGTDEFANTRTITQFGKIVEDADRLGIPLIGEYIPYGSIDRFNGDVRDLALGARACAEFGADLIKTVYTDKFEEISRVTVVPTLALGGGTFSKPSDAFQLAQKAKTKGAAGIVFGRNVVCAQKPKEYLDALLSVMKEDVPPLEAERQYLKTL